MQVAGVSGEAVEAVEEGVEVGDMVWAQWGKKRNEKAPSTYVILRDI